MNSAILISQLRALGDEGFTVGWQAAEYILDLENSAKVYKAENLTLANDNYEYLERIGALDTQVQEQRRCLAATVALLGCTHWPLSTLSTKDPTHG